LKVILDADNAIELARKTTNHVAKAYVKAYPKRFGFLCCIAMQKPEQAVRELERVVK